MEPPERCGDILRIAAHIYRNLGEALDHSAGREISGFLLGRKSSAGGSVTALLFGAPAQAAIDEFEISDAELRRNRAWAEDHQLEILALFHSHPSGCARLSESDRATLRHSEWPWIVVTRQAQGGTILLSGYQPGIGAPLSVQVGGEQALRPPSTDRRRQ